MINSAEQDKIEQLRMRNLQAREYDQLLLAKGPFYTAVEWAFTLRGLRLTSEDTLFDAGCGTGRLTVPLARYVKQVTCCDFSAESLAVLKEKCLAGGITNIELHQLDMTQPLPFADESFSKIYSNNVLPFIAPEHQPLAVGEWRRVLKPNGGICLAMHYRLGGGVAGQNREDYFEGPLGRLYRYAFTPEDLGEKLRDAGFTDVHVEGLMALPGRLGSLLEKCGLAPIADRWAAAVNPTSLYLGATASRSH